MELFKKFLRKMSIKEGGKPDLAAAHWGGEDR